MEDTEAQKKKADALQEEMKKREEEAEELKRKEAQRLEDKRLAIEERVGEPRNTDGLADEQLKELMTQYHERVAMIESQKYDLERKILGDSIEIEELYKKVYDLRGKFVKPKLKKVHHEFDDITAN